MQGTGCGQISFDSFFSSGMSSASHRLGAAGGSQFTFAAQNWPWGRRRAYSADALCRRPWCPSPVSALAAVPWFRDKSAEIGEGGARTGGEVVARDLPLIDEIANGRILWFVRFRIFLKFRSHGVVGYHMSFTRIGSGVRASLRSRVSFGSFFISK